DVVDALGDVGKNAADPPPALAELLEFKGAAHHVAGGAGRRFDAHAVAGIELLPVAPDQLRLVIEGVALTYAAVHEELDDALHLRRVVGPAGRRVRRGRVSSKKSLLTEEVSQCHAAQAAAEAPEHRAA